MIKLYGNFGSGNVLKVKYIADATGTPYELHEITSRSGGTSTDEFLALNPAGQMPVIVLEDGRPLAQSNAILRYLAHGSRFLPTDRYEAAKVDEWLFWEQYSHEPTVAVARARVVYDKQAVADLDPALVEKGNKALDIMNEALKDRKWLVGETMTIADIALLPYTRQSPLGGFDLSGRTALLRWIAACEQELGLPSFETEN